MADAITSALADIFVDSVTVEHHTGQADEEGDVTFGAGTARACRVSGGGERLTAPDGTEFVSRGKVSFAGDFDVRRGDRLTLPADFDPQTAIVKKVKTPRHEGGNHHQVAWF